MRTPQSKLSGHPVKSNGWSQLRPKGSEQCPPRALSGHAKQPAQRGHRKHRLITARGRGGEPSCSSPVHRVGERVGTLRASRSLTQGITPMIKRIFATISALVLAGSLSSVNAEGLVHKAQLTEVNDACRDDALRLCPGVLPGRGLIAVCLVAHLRELSKPCYDALSVTAALKSCEVDRLRYCPGVIPGRGRVLSCLAEYTTELSPPCAAALEANLPGFPNE